MRRIYVIHDNHASVDFFIQYTSNFITNYNRIYQGELKIISCDLTNYLLTFCVFKGI